jgi:hypothetical protein
MEVKGLAGKVPAMRFSLGNAGKAHAAVSGYIRASTHAVAVPTRGFQSWVIIMSWYEMLCAHLWFNACKARAPLPYRERLVT